jgi:hypothetical protein
MKPTACEFQNPKAGAHGTQSFGLQCYGDSTFENKAYRAVKQTKVLDEIVNENKKRKKKERREPPPLVLFWCKTDIT